MGTRRRSPSNGFGIVALVASCLAIVASCQQPGDRASILEERSRYSVDLLSWALRDDGTIAATVRVRGPVHSRLDVLTVELLRLGADGSVQRSEWISLDLSGMVMGAAFERTLVLPAGEESPERMGVDLHEDPSPEVLPRLKELEGIP